MENDDRPLVRLESGHRPVELIPIGERLGVIGDRPDGDRSDLELDRSSAPAPSPVEGGLGGQAMEPGIEPIRVAKPGQVAPGANERVLDRVARELTVAEDQPGGGVEPDNGRAGQRGEGVMIAMPCPLDEVPLRHDGSLNGATHSVALDTVWRRRLGNRSTT
jgi:hypothetical protein